jgi:hypothetical protein
VHEQDFLQVVAKGCLCFLWYAQLVALVEGLELGRALAPEAHTREIFYDSQLVYTPPIRDITWASRGSVREELVRKTHFFVAVSPS